ncbi:MAG: 2-amino-4-hydroxy-6-hydroxymethyldihydropteridine diphosphokinase [Candidatus Omnitrophica bacterium]|nr:2-amino-4-hydroxy-6-hydroxymethyldihydropteridine diphosphokinase [Candidatus Omnitrophota bacterium]
MAVCYLGIGSNMGNRERNIRLAIKKIGALEDTRILKISDIIETTPVGGPPCQRKFLNAVVKIHTWIAPLRLLKRLKNIERSIGRRKSVRFGPRIIDLDILLYGNMIIYKSNLMVPHPRMFEREFVIKPLLQVI